MRYKSTPLLSVIFCSFLCFRAIAQDDATYKMPPKTIMDLALAKPTPSVAIDQNASWMIIMERSGLTTIEALAQPELRIAGLRIDPANFSPSRGNYFLTLQLKNIKTKEIFDLKGLPQDLKGGALQWSPDEKQFAFTNTANDKVDLYRVNVAEKKAYKVNQSALNTVLGGSFAWVGSDTLVYKTVPAGLKVLAAKESAPKGPIVQESKGKAGASRTYEDLIKNPFDEAMFEYYGTSQIVKSNFTTETPVGSPGIYSSMDVSPDKNYLLLQRVKKPFSYLVPYYGFPKAVEVANLSGTVIKVLADNPSSEGSPIGFDDVVTFPRQFDWRDDQPATVYYVQALDKGMGRSKAAYRDAIFTLAVNSSETPKELFKTKMRFGRVQWGNEHFAMVYEDMNATRRIRMDVLDPSSGKLDSLFERSSNDAYSDLGSPVTVKNQYGRSVVWTKDNAQIMLTSEGASPEGSMPLIQTYDVKTGKANILWRAQAPFYETVVDVVDPARLIFITSRESQTEVPNYYLRDLKKKSLIGTPITDFKNPYTELEGVQKQKISYKREDGINLTADLYLPKNYDAKKDGPLPVLMWAYPREYKNAADAAQVRGSKYRFTRINYGSPIFWVTQGYAIMDNTEMPIVGEGDKEPNDNFIPQLYLNAHAAIQAVAKMGVGDSNRVGVGGHSYGAFMTANLLAHTNLFKAGIARSGAYNRTLTPFGFQAEERTYWESPDVYYKMSPFSYANNIKTPLLLIHGEADNNSGTFPIQSERLYNAVKGHGGTVRLIMLPFESHGYAAKENILHMLWEQNSWLEQYVKSKNPNAAGGDDKSRKAF